MSGRLDLSVNVIRQTQLADDPIGGAMYTGTVAYANLPASIKAQRPTQGEQRQGLETPVSYELTVQAMLWETHVVLDEKDEVEVTGPYDNPWLGWRFRIMGVIPPGVIHRRHTDQHATISRIEDTRRESW